MKKELDFRENKDEVKGIHLFEWAGKDVNEGDVFIAHVDSVEGRKRVTLVKKNG